MIAKLRIQLFITLLLVVLGLYGCTLPDTRQGDTMGTTSTPGDIPTWTPRPEDLTALPTATQPATAKPTVESTQATETTPLPTRTLKPITITLDGGNLNVRRGPSTDYNPLYVLRDGETAVAIGRDRISRWILIEVPSVPGAQGWVTTETDFSTVTGDLPSLPFLTVEPAEPAFIRNCTKHDMLVLPDEVKLLDKFNKPDNEERFGPGVYQVYDLDGPDDIYETVSLREGMRVDIQYDGNGEKSKCE